MESLRPKTIKDLMPTKLAKMRLVLAGPAIALLMLPACATAKESQVHSPLAPTPTPSTAHATPTPGVDIDTLIKNITQGNENLRQENEELRKRMAPTPTQRPTLTEQPTPIPILKATPTPTTKPQDTQKPSPTLTATPTETPTTIPQEIKFEIGNPEAINISGITHYPDGHTSFIQDSKGVRAWIAGAQEGYLLTGTSIDNLSPTATKVIGPSGQETFDRDYAAPGSLIPGKNPDELLMFYHGESYPNQPASKPFDAAIGLAISTDGGTTLKKEGPIIEGMSKRTRPDIPFGAGQPSVIRNGDFLYLYYSDWNGGKYPDSIHLARAPIDSNGMPGSWEKFNGQQFENKGPAGPSTPVVYPLPGENYTAIPGVSYNTHLKQFIMVFESRSGFFTVISPDGIKWSKPTLLLSVKTANNNPQPGDTWSSYPTLLSPSKPNDRETDQDLLLVYSEGSWNQGPHSMVKRTVKLSK